MIYEGILLEQPKLQICTIIIVLDMNPKPKFNLRKKQSIPTLGGIRPHHTGDKCNSRRKLTRSGLNVTSRNLHFKKTYIKAVLKTQRYWFSNERVGWESSCSSPVLVTAAWAANLFSASSRATVDKAAEMSPDEACEVILLMRKAR